jgi:hypothetical protein
MATEKKVAIYPAAANVPDGYDATYTTMALFEAGEDVDITVGSGTDEYILCEITPSDGSWNGAPDTDPTIFDGWKCDRSNGNYVRVTTIGSARSSDGKWDTGAYIMSLADHAITLDNDTSASDFLDIEFEGIQINISNNDEPFRTRAIAYHGDIRILRCYFRTSTGYSIVNDTSDGTNLKLRIKNTVAISGGAYCFYNSGAHNLMYIYNSTFEDATNDNIRSTSGTVNAVNVVSFNSPDDFNGITCSYCASDDGDGTDPVDISPGGDESADWHSAMTDPDAAPPDVSIKDVNSVLYHSGETQNNDSEIPTTDIAGVTRPAGDSRVSIGAFEWETAEEGITVLASTYYNRIRRVSGD